MKIGSGRIDKGDFIMHVKSMDVCWEVLQVLLQDRTSTLIILRPWNLGYEGRPWLISDEETVVYLNRSEFDEWRILDPEVMTNKRTQGGLPPESI